VGVHSKCPNLCKMESSRLKGRRVEVSRCYRSQLQLVQENIGVLGTFMNYIEVLLPKCSALPNRSLKDAIFIRGQVRYLRSHGSRSTCPHICHAYNNLESPYMEHKVGSIYLWACDSKMPMCDTQVKHGDLENTRKKTFYELCIYSSYAAHTC
ncbi:hypothetical protein HAX54_036887, partial [Datura stramonium]|nr:hypothetical protein [Datura stramonium]